MKGRVSRLGPFIPCRTIQFGEMLTQGIGGIMIGHVLEFEFELICLFFAQYLFVPLGFIEGLCFFVGTTDILYLFFDFQH